MGRMRNIAEIENRSYARCSYLAKRINKLRTEIDNLREEIKITTDLERGTKENKNMLNEIVNTKKKLGQEIITKGKEETKIMQSIEKMAHDEDKDTEIADRTMMPRYEEALERIRKKATESDRIESERN